jgi:hypothetical protein
LTDAGRWVAVCAAGDGTHGALAEVEHRLLDLGGRLGAVEVATHTVRAPEGAHSAGSLRLDGAADPAGVVGGWLRPGESAVVLSADREVHLGDGGHAGHAAATARAHRRRESGRLVRFPGSAALPHVLPLAELTARCAVEAVDLLGVADAPGLLLRTRGHVRPLFRDGVLVLAVTAWDDGEVCPFERPAPRACCADH